MNELYDHSHHAGNKGDVWKHFILVTVVDRLSAAADTFRYVDTHAGAPRHRLGPGGEWMQGIGQVPGGCGALRDHGYLEVAVRWMEKGRYPSAWWLVAERAAARAARVDVRLTDISEPVAECYSDPESFDLPQTVAVHRLEEAGALDKKTGELAYLAVLAALRLESGVPFHVKMAKEAGASRGEVISALLVGLPAAGNAVTASLPAALQAYDAD